MQKNGKVGIWKQIGVHRLGATVQVIILGHVFRHKDIYKSRIKY